MSSYDPAEGVALNQSDVTFIALLSQRDVSLQVPINFVNAPGVSLSAACFGHNEYLQNNTARCISNLLAANFQRVSVDLYWDAIRGIWSLCPVQLPRSSSTTRKSSTHLAITTIASARLTGRAALPQGLSSNLITVTAMSVSATSEEVASPTTLNTHNSTSTATLQANVSATSTLMGPGPAETSGAGQDTIFSVGPYLCSPMATVDLLMDVVNGRLKATDDSINATLVDLIINIHTAVAVSGATDNVADSTSSEMLRNATRLSQVFSDSLDPWLYTPVQLASQRGNLNASGSWFAHVPSNRPLSSYFQVDVGNGYDYTKDGWPSEGYVELINYKRLLTAFGAVDPLTQSYNFSADADTIFPPSYLEENRAFTTASNGSVNAGCFFDLANTSFAAANSSWATAEVSGPAGTSLSDALIYTEAHSLTSCGITPVLNTTLNNLTADQDYRPYQEYVRNTIWSWAPGEPGLNTSAVSGRCGALNSSSGQWNAVNCAATHSGACRVGNQPYKWQISVSSTNYNKIAQACPSNSSFDTPRTAVENAYLLAAFREHQTKHVDSASSLLWLNLNDLDLPNCWVIGQNTSCPYKEETTSDHTREVAVPAVAAIIILVIAVLTVLVKCSGHHKDSKRRRRRGDGGWDYEGVPA